MDDERDSRSAEDEDIDFQSGEDELPARGRRAPANNAGRARTPDRRPVGPTSSAPSKTISTLYIVGFPDEALCRELKNLCRLFPGFEGCAIQNTGQKGGGQSSLFAKFATSRDAEDAMAQLGNVPFDEEHPDHFRLKVQIARRDLDVGDSYNFSERMGLQPGESPTLATIRQGPRRPAERGRGDGGRGDGGRGGDDRGPPPASDYDRPSKRPRNEGANEERRPPRGRGDNGVSRRDEEHGRNDRGGAPSGGRPRQSERDQDRIEDRRRPPHGEGVATRTRFRLEDDHGGRGCERSDRGNRENDRHDRDGGRNHRDRERDTNQRAAPGGTAGGIDTLAVLNMSEKGLSEDRLRQLAGREVGFLKMHHVPKLDGFFIKYESPEDAMNAQDALSRKNIDAEMARRNLELRN